MALPLFVATGCSRSGTQYVARLITALGRRCGHERVFSIHRVQNGADAASLFRGVSGAGGDSSFLAVPFLPTLPPGTVVLHQVRDPIEVIRSHMGIGFFAEEYEPSDVLASNHPDFLRFIERHCPRVFRDADPLLRCVRYWVGWNRLAERAAAAERLSYLRYRVEDLDRPLVGRIAERLGIAAADGVIDAALAKVPRSANHRSRDESVGWKSLPGGEERDELAALARSYGYRLDEA